MQIEYKNCQIKRICTLASVAERKHGKRMAELIHLRVDEILAAESVEMMVQYRIGRCHPLKGDRKGQYALDLVYPFRLIFKVKDEKIQIAWIMKIEDYH